MPNDTLAIKIKALDYAVELLKQQQNHPDFFYQADWLILNAEKIEEYLKKGVQP